MSKIFDFFGWVLLALLLLWATGMIFAGEQCVRVHRAAWPVTYTMGAIETASQFWTDDATKLQLLLWKAHGAIRAEHFFEKTVYGDKSKCTK